MRSTKRVFSLAVSMALVICLALVVMLAGDYWPLAQAGAQAQAVVGTIAYVRADTRDEIRLVQPDGSGDRRLWASGAADPEGGSAVWSLSWRPGAPELVFSSTHEGFCSVNAADVFTIHADKSAYRRLTEAPACAALADYPLGTVQVPVSNVGSGSFTGFVTIQGATGSKQVTLPPGGSTVITFEQVADFGPGVLQYAAYFRGPNRQVQTGASVDVQAGSSSLTANLNVTPLSNFAYWEVSSPAWRRDGDRIAYVRNSNTLQWLSPTPTPLEFGSPLLEASEETLPDLVSLLAYGPTPGTASQILYAGAQAFGSGGVYRVTEGSNTPGERLVTHSFTDAILGLAWLPDGSGFVYSLLKAGAYPDYNHNANLFLYKFGTKSSQRLTGFEGEFTGKLAVSPDGQTILFERDDQVSSLAELVNPDLWMVNQDGSGLRVFKVNARTPAWSEVEVPAPPGPAAELFLPVLVR